MTVDEILKQAKERSEAKRLAAFKARIKVLGAEYLERVKG